MGSAPARPGGRPPRRLLPPPAPAARPSGRGPTPPAGGTGGPSSTETSRSRCSGERTTPWNRTDFERGLRRPALERAVTASGGAAGPAVALLALLVETLGDDVGAIALQPSLSELGPRAHPTSAPSWRWRWRVRAIPRRRLPLLRGASEHPDRRGQRGARVARSRLRAGNAPSRRPPTSPSSASAIRRTPPSSAWPTGSPASGPRRAVLPKRSWRRSSPQVGTARPRTRRPRCWRAGRRARGGAACPPGRRGAAAAGARGGRAAGARDRGSAPGAARRRAGGARTGAARRARIKRRPPRLAGSGPGAAPACRRARSDGALSLARPDVGPRDVARPGGGGAGDRGREAAPRQRSAGSARRARPARDHAGAGGRGEADRAGSAGRDRRPTGGASARGGRRGARGSGRRRRSLRARATGRAGAARPRRRGARRGGGSARGGSADRGQRKARGRRRPAPPNRAPLRGAGARRRAVGRGAPGGAPALGAGEAGHPGGDPAGLPCRDRPRARAPWRGGGPRRDADHDGGACLAHRGRTHPRARGGATGPGVGPARRRGQPDGACTHGAAHPRAGRDGLLPRPGAHGLAQQCSRRPARDRRGAPHDRAVPAGARDRAPGVPRGRGSDRGRPWRGVAPLLRGHARRQGRLGVPRAGHRPRDAPGGAGDPRGDPDGGHRGDARGARWLLQGRGPHPSRGARRAGARRPLPSARRGRHVRDCAPIRRGPRGGGRDRGWAVARGAAPGPRVAAEAAPRGPPNRTRTSA